MNESQLVAATGGKTAAELFSSIKVNIVNPIITLLALAAFLVFIWGVVDFIRGADDAEKRKTGQQHMVWGIIGLVIIFGAGAIVQIIANSIGVQLPK